MEEVTRGSKGGPVSLIHFSIPPFVARVYGATSLSQALGWVLGAGCWLLGLGGDEDSSWLMWRAHILTEKTTI